MEAVDELLNALRLILDRMMLASVQPRHTAAFGSILAAIERNQQLLVGSIFGSLVSHKFCVFLSLLFHVKWSIYSVSVDNRYGGNALCLIKVKAGRF